MLNKMYLPSHWLYLSQYCPSEFPCVSRKEVLIMVCSHTLMAVKSNSPASQVGLGWFLWDSRYIQNT